MRCMFAVVALGAFALASDVRTDQYGVLVFDAGCIKSAKIVRETKYEVPLRDDGSPDFSRGKLLGISLDIERTCGHIEVRKK